MTAAALSPREMKRRRKISRLSRRLAPYSVGNALTKGDVFTKLSAVVFGLGNIVRKQYVRGVALLALEIAFFVFLFTNGITCLSKLPAWATGNRARYSSTASGSTPRATIPWSSCCTASARWCSACSSSICGWFRSSPHTRPSAWPASRARPRAWATICVS